MATHDYVIANDTHANLRADLNLALSAIVTKNSSSGAPASTFANMIYADTATTPNKYKVRNNANTTFYNVFTDTGLLCVEDGAVGTPSIGWNTTRTHGLYYGSATSWSAAVAGVNAFTLSSTLHGWNLAAGDIDHSIGATGGGANSFFVQGSDGFIGIRNGTPEFSVHGKIDATSFAWMGSVASSGSANHASQFAGMRSRGTHAVPLILGTTDLLVSLAGYAYHTTGTPGFVMSGDIKILAEGVESGNTVPTAITFRTMPSGGAITERVRISSAGLVGIGTTAPSFDLSFGGNVTRAMQLERHTTANTEGNTFGIYAGGATVGATDKNGGLLVIGPGISTGLGKSNIVLQNYTSALSTGTADNTLTNRAFFCCFYLLTDAVATSIVSLTAATLLAAAVTIRYAVHATNGVDVQCETGTVTVSVVNKGGVFTTDVDKSTVSTAISAGTLGVTFTVTSANPAVIQVNADTSLVASTGYPHILFSVENHSQQVIALA